MIRIIIISLLFTAVAVAQDNSSKGMFIENERLINTQELIATLREKEKALNARESDLNAREERIRIIENDIISRENDLKKLRQEVTDKINELSIAEDKEADKLAGMYSSSKAKSVAVILLKMNVERAANIVKRMPPRSAGSVMNEMAKYDPAFAAKIGEFLTPDSTFSMP